MSRPLVNTPDDSQKPEDKQSRYDKPRCGTCKKPCEWNVKAGITLCCGADHIILTPAYRTFE